MRAPFKDVGKPRNSQLALSIAATIFVVAAAAWQLLAEPASENPFGRGVPGSAATFDDQALSDLAIAPGDQPESGSNEYATDSFTKPQASDPKNESSQSRDFKNEFEGQSKPASSRGPPQADAEDESDALRYGILREIGPDRFMSPQGLQYAPGSAEGHRLEHLRRHTADQPSRPGKHGVFDGGMEGALKTIDRAYELAKKNQRTTKQVDRNRTLYTVDLGKRVGFVGGREGNRRRKPMARRVKLVLEGNRVITAFPL